MKSQVSSGIIISVLVLLSFSCLTAQFWQNDVKWIYQQDIFVPPEPDLVTRTLTKVKDTLVNGFDCVIIQEELSNSDFTKQHTLRYLSSTIDFYDEYDDSFNRVYDFNLEQGDILLSYCEFNEIFVEHMVDSTYQVIIDGDTRKAMMVRALDFSCGFSGELIEGIGSDKYLFPRPNFIDPPPGGRLLCYSEGDVSYPSSEACSQLVSTASIMDSRVYAYPNPSDGRIQIEAVDYDRYDVISADGDVLTSGRATRNIDLSDMERGLYFIRLVYRKGPSRLIRVVR